MSKQGAKNTPPRVHPDRMLKPDRKAGSHIAFVLDAPGLYTVRWKHRPALGAEKSARGLVHGLAQLDRNLLITVAA
ncbi:MAG: hypothetical protein AAGH90_08960, partial [Pseudomonadota bacterium]